jgi:hypothetical protein
MRLILAVGDPSAGIVNIDGKPYQQSAASMRKVGTLLDARAVHGRRKIPEHDSKASSQFNVLCATAIWPRCAGTIIAANNPWAGASTSPNPAS